MDGVFKVYATNERGTPVVFYVAAASPQVARRFINLHIPYLVSVDMVAPWERSDVPSLFPIINASFAESGGV